jgi:uncharacterized membrane protein
MKFLTDALLALHILGIALIIGPFLFQMRTRSGFKFGLMLIGAITDVVTGLGLWWIINVGLKGDIAIFWIVVKLVIAVIVLGAVVYAMVLQRRAIASGTSERVSQPWLHVAGGFAIVNVIFAIFAH